MEATIIELLKKLKIPVSSSYCERIIASHTDYPSVLSVADAFERLGIEYAIGKIEKEDLKEIDFPYILSIDNREQELILIEKEKDLVKNTKKLELWNGIIITAEKPKQILDEDHNEQYKKEKVFNWGLRSLLVIISLMVIWPIANTTNRWTDYLFLTTSILGVVVGYFLIAKEFGVQNKLVDNFCKTGKNTDCDQILQSQASSIFGIIRFSDIVVSYFTFQLIFLALTSAILGTISSALNILTISSALTLPIIVYSLYYQKIVVKVWCRLCLVVVAILLAQAIILNVFLIGGFFTLPKNIFLYISAGLGFLALLTISIIIRYLFEKNYTTTANSFITARIANDPKNFLNKLYRGKKINTSAFETEIRIGNAASPIQITMASNLFCKPCKNMHHQLSNLIQMFGHKVGITFRYVDTNIDADFNISAFNYILRYHKQNILGKKDESQLTVQLLHDWYELMNLSKFAQKYPVDYSQENIHINELENMHYNWVRDAKITGTPTLFINEYEFPQLYQTSLLPNLVLALSEELEKAFITK